MLFNVEKYCIAKLQEGWYDYDSVYQDTSDRLSGKIALKVGDIFAGDNITLVVTDILERDIKGSTYGAIHGDLGHFNEVGLESFVIDQIREYAEEPGLGYYWLNYWGNNPQFSQDLMKRYSNLKGN